MCAPKMDVNFWKIIAMIALGFGSFLVAMIPGWFALNNRSFTFLKTIMLCFGGGVLISTSMLHILPEVRETIPKTAEFWFLGGFFLVYLIEELIHWFHERKYRRRRGINSSSHPRSRSCGHGNYGAIGNEDHEASPKHEDDVENILNLVDHHMINGNGSNDHRHSHTSMLESYTKMGNCSNIVKADVHTGGDPCEREKDDQMNEDIGPGCSATRRCQGQRYSSELLYAPDGIANPNHVGIIMVHKRKNPKEQGEFVSKNDRQVVRDEDKQPLLPQEEERHESNAAGIIGMLVALLVHSSLEGFVIGLQPTESQVILLLTAVASHKYVVGFCLGGELAGAPGGAGGTPHVLGALIFSLGSVLGIGLGALVQIYSQSDAGTMPVLQGLAGGTLFYVALGEVVPRERALRRCGRPSTGVWQCLAVGLGVTLMAILNQCFNEPEEHKQPLGG